MIDPNKLKKSEQKVFLYIREMFPDYEWRKTAGNGVPDFMGYPPDDSDLPVLFVESKCGLDSLRESQKEFSNSMFGLRASGDDALWVVYTPDDTSETHCFAYPWDAYLRFVDKEGCRARIIRKKAEKKLREPFDHHTDEIVSLRDNDPEKWTWQELDIHFWPDIPIQKTSSTGRKTPASKGWRSWGIYKKAKAAK
jgi:hypothetical protein